MAKPDMKQIADYCKLPPETETDDPVFVSCYQAAIEYAANAGVSEPEESSELYNLLIAMLTSTWYDNRGSVLVGQTPHELERSVQSIIHQLRY